MFQFCFQSKIIRRVFVIISLILFTCTLNAQGTADDYERAMNLHETTAGKVFKDRVTPHWFAGNNCFWYRNDLSDKKHEFILVDARVGTRKEAFDHVRLARTLSKKTGRDIHPDNLPFKSIAFNNSLNELRFSANGKAWKCNLKTYRLQPVNYTDDIKEVLTPSFTVVASTDDGNDASIRFVNNSKEKLQIYWINRNSQKELYHTLPAGKEHEQYTFAGHTWLVTNTKGDKIAVYTAGEDMSKAVFWEDRHQTLENLQEFLRVHLQLHVL